MVSILIKHASQDRSRLLSFLNHRNIHGKTALIDACETAHPNIVRTLLDNGVNYTLSDNDNFTALHWCTWRNRQNCIRMVLDLAKRSEPGRFRKFLNQQGNKNLATALRDAALARHTDMANLLLEYGPDVEIVDKGKRNALHQAIGTKNLDLAVGLVEYASKDPDKERLRRFVNAQDEREDTAWRRSG